MNAESFIKLVSKNADFTFLDTQKFFDSLEKSINQCIQNKEGFTILNFGTLDYSKTKERTVNSKMFGLRTFPEVKTVFFRLSTNLKKLFKEVNKT